MSKGSLQIIGYPAEPYQRGIKAVPSDYLLSGGTFEIHCFKSDVIGEFLSAAVNKEA